MLPLNDLRFGVKVHVLVRKVGLGRPLFNTQTEE